jgi:hypothetical protein
MNILVAGQLPGMSKASGSIPSSKKTKLNKMKQTKKK